MTPRPHTPIRRRSGTDRDLIELLRRLDGKSYGSYKSATGDWDYGDFSIAIDRVQSDPYAPPSAVRVIASPQTMGIPDAGLSTHTQRVASADFLLRSFSHAIRKMSGQGSGGAGHGSPVQVARTGQEILERSACTVMPDRVELRFQVHMPARGRTIQGLTAARIFDQDVPDIVVETFDFVSDQADRHLDDLHQHVHTYEDYQALQQALVDNNWVTFVADDAILARRSGVSDLPMEDAVPFSSPESLRRTVTLPHAGEVSGMALEPGVTVIVGGGYHGKSTLLAAIQRSVYAHVPADGRQLVATTPSAMKVRAADGRPVTGVDVSAFIAHLPGGADTSDFSTQNASGSTSQAAAIVEAVELGSPLLMLDEDTSATNLLIRDARMRRLVAAEREPITPLVDRVRALFDQRHVSTLMVMGGSGDYLDIADCVLMMDTYQCRDVTDQARAVVAEMPRERTDEEDFPGGRPRVLMRDRGNSGRGKPKTKSAGLDTITLDRHTVDVSDVEQIVDAGQTEAIAWALRTVLNDLADGEHSIDQELERLDEMIGEQSLDVLTKDRGRPWPAFLVRPRPIDIGAAVNRYRALTMR